MPSYTKKTTLFEVLAPIYELAMDIALSVAPRSSTRQLTGVAAIKSGEITFADRPLAEEADISNHRRLQIADLRATGKTDILAPLETLLADIPPLLGSRAPLRLRIYRYKTPFCVLDLDNVVICEDETRPKFMNGVYSFLRTHENLDMATELRPHKLITPEHLKWGSRHQLLADTPENALLRFASIDPDLQRMIKRGEDICCCPVRDPKEDFVLRALKGRVRDMPAPPKNWVLPSSVTT